MERLSFTIKGKTWSYPGKPETRVKDYMVLCAKNNIAEDIVVEFFPSNCPEATHMSPEQIRTSYQHCVEAQRRKKEKRAQAAQGGSSSSLPSPALSSPQPEEEIEKRTAHLNDKKQQQPSHVDPAVKTKVVTPAQGSSPQTSDRVTFSNTNSQEPSQSTAACPPEHLVQSGFTQEEIEKLHQFIQSVVDEPEEGMHGRLLSMPSNSTQGQPVIAVREPSTSPRHPSGNTSRNNSGKNSRVCTPGMSPAISPRSHEGDDYSSRSVDGKLKIYLKFTDSDRQNVVALPTGADYDYFNAMLHKKLKTDVVTTFADEDGEEIEVDDDDTLQMFLDQPMKKYKLTCRPRNALRHGRSEDQLQQQTSDASPKDMTERRTSSATGLGLTHSSTMSLLPSTLQKRNTIYSRPTLRSTDNCLRTFNGHSEAVYCCAFSKDGDMFVTSSRDKTVRVWDIAAGTNKVLKGHSGVVISCDFSPSGANVVSSSDDGSVRVWNVSTGKRILKMKGHGDKVYCCVYNSNGAYIASASSDTTACVWKADTGAKAAVLKGHTKPVFSCAFSHTDYGKFVATASDDKLIKVWDWQKEELILTLSGHYGTVWACNFSHDDSYIISASMDEELALWDTATGSLIRRFAGHNSAIHYVTFTPDDKYIVSCARDMAVLLWTVDEKEPIQQYEGHEHTVFHVACHGDKILSCSVDSTVKLWQLPEA